MPEYDDAGKLKDFQPATFVLGFGQIDGRKVIVGGEDFTVRGGSPNPRVCAKVSIPNNWRCNIKCRLFACMRAAAVRSVAPIRRKPSPFGRAGIFAIALCAFGPNPVRRAGGFCRIGAGRRSPAARLVASHFTVMTQNAAVLIAGRKWSSVRSRYDQGRIGRATSAFKLRRD